MGEQAGPEACPGVFFLLCVCLTEAASNPLGDPAYKLGGEHYDSKRLHRNPGEWL